MSPIAICLIIFVISLVLYAAGTKKIPMGVTAMLSIAALLFTKCITASAATAMFSNTNVIMIASMFVMSNALGRTTYIKKFSRAFIKLTGNSFKGAWIGYTLLALILTSVLTSSMVVFSILFPLCASMCDEFGVSRSKVMYPLMVLALIGSPVAPSGYAVTAMSQINGYFEQFGVKAAVALTDFLKARWGVYIVGILWSIFYVPRVAPDNVIDTGVDSKQASGKEIPKYADLGCVIIFFACVIMMLLNKVTGIAPWQVAFAAACLASATGIMSKKEIIESMNLDMVLMLVGALTMAGALQTTGAGAYVGDLLAKLVGNTHNSYVLGALFYVVPFIVTQFMMNQATMNIFYPIAILTCQSLGANPVGVCILVSAGCMCSFLTPMATPGIGMAMSLGGHDIKQLLKMGWLLAVVLAVVQVVICMTAFPAF